MKNQSKDVSITGKNIEKIFVLLAVENCVFVQEHKLRSQWTWMWDINYEELVDFFLPLHISLSVVYLLYIFLIDGVLYFDFFSVVYTISEIPDYKILRLYLSCCWTVLYFAVPCLYSFIPPHEGDGASLKIRVWIVLHESMPPWTWGFGFHRIILPMLQIPTWFIQMRMPLLMTVHHLLLLLALPWKEFAKIFQKHGCGLWSLLGMSRNFWVIIFQKKHFTKLKNEKAMEVAVNRWGMQSRL